MTRRQKPRRQKVLISEFKARCIELIKRVQATRMPLVVTLRGRPIAKVVPFEGETEQGVKLGSRIGNAVIKGDIVHADTSEDWEFKP
jgi:prevent-host-death family protein